MRRGSPAINGKCATTEGTEERQNFRLAHVIEDRADEPSHNSTFHCLP